jgi:osmotically-inducible protein OsmY
MSTGSKPKLSSRPDEDIARDVKASIKFDSDVPDERIRVTVHDGLVTLEGTVETSLQKVAAETDARKVKGVRTVENRIQV